MVGLDRRGNRILPARRWKSYSVLTPCRIVGGLDPPYAPGRPGSRTWASGLGQHVITHAFAE